MKWLRKWKFKKKFDKTPTDSMYKDISPEGMITKLKELIAEERELENRVHTYKNSIDDLTTISNLPEEDYHQLKSAMRSIGNAQDEKKALQHKIKSLQVQHIPEDFYSPDFYKKLEDIRKSDERQRLAKSDMNYLEGEKGFLDYEKEKNEKILKILRSMGLGIAVFVGATSLVFSVLYTLYEINLAVPVVVLFVLALFSICWVHMWKRHLYYQLRMNVKKQERATLLLNKAKLKYVRHTKFLNYTYKKYGVESMQKLVKKWEDYSQFKKTNAQYMEMSKYEGETLTVLDKIISRYNILEDAYLLEQSGRLVTREDCLEAIKDLKQDTKKTEKALADIQRQLRNTWQVVNHLKTTDEKLSEQISQMISDEVV